ncbi:MAG: PAS-domain containing protein, partial [Burkholderiaceae bacterium]
MSFSPDPSHPVAAPPGAQQRFENILNCIDGIVWEADPRTFRFTFVSAQAEQILGYPIEDWYANGFWADHIHPQDREQALSYCALQTRSGSNHAFEYRMLAADGRVVWLKDSVSVSAGQPVYICGIMVEITEQKQLLQTIAEQVFFFRQLVDTIPSPIFWKDAQGLYQGCNQAFEAYIGIKGADLIGKSVFEIAPPELATIYAAADQALFDSRGSQIYEATVRYADESLRNVVFYKATFLKEGGSLGGLVGVMLDITERQQLAEALHQKNSLLQKVIDNIPCGISMTDAELNIILINRRAQAILDVPDTLFENGGTTLEQVYRFNAARGEYGPGDPATQVEARLKRAHLHQSHLMERTRPDGTVIEVRGVPLAEGGFVTVYLDVTREKSVEASLARETASLQAVLTHMPQGISVFDEHLRLKHWNAGLVEVLNLPPDIVVQDVHFDDLIRVPAIRGEYGPGEPEQHVARVHALAMQFKPHQFKRTQPSGKTHLVSGQPMQVCGELTGFITTYTDITELEQAEQALRLSATVFESSTEGILITDAATRILKVNRAFCAITGYAADEVLGQTPKLLQTGQQDAAFYQSMWQAIAADGHWSGEICSRRKSGEVFIERLSISRVLDAAGAVTNYIGIFSDISHVKAAQSQIERLSFFDALTNLPNRVLLQDRLQQALHNAERNKRRIALLTIDIDRLSHINDTLGHHVGDQVIVVVADRLVSSVRAVDTVSRHRGDEFALILEDLDDAQDAAQMAERVLASLGASFWLEKHEISISASIGISIFPEDGKTPLVLLKNADVALHHAKGSGSFQFFREEMNAAAMERMLIENSLRLALRRNEFRVYYQAQLDFASGRITGMEALVRWAHPELGLVSPLRFIPVAEETGQIIEIGLWVLRAACQETRRWHDQGYHHLQVAVNVSARQFNQDDFAAQV